MNDQLLKYKAEFARELAAKRYQITSNGLLLTRPGVTFGGVFVHRENNGPQIVDNNTFVYEGLNDILNIIFNAGAQQTAFYIAPFINNTAPVATLTAATFVTTQGEFTNYTEGTRGVWTVDGDSTTQTTGNSASPARFTIGTGGGTIRGAGLVTAQAKSATTGKLYAAALFDTASVLNAGSKLDIEYQITAQDA